MVNAVFCHVAVGRPLPANDSEQSRVVNVDRAIAREGFGFMVPWNLDQRTNASIGTQDILPLRWTAQIETCSFKDELDLLIERTKLIRWMVDGSIRGPHDRVHRRSASMRSNRNSKPPIECAKN